VLWTVVSFFTAQFIAGLALDHWILSVRFPTAGHLFTQLQSWPRPPDIVCFGSSRFAGDIQPEVLNVLLGKSLARPPRVFNAAVAAGDVLVADWLLERMLRQGYRPAVVVVEVCPENLARNCAWLEGQALRQMTWRDLGAHFPDVLAYSHKPMLLVGARVVPMYQFRLQICRYLEDLVTSWSGGQPDPPVGVCVNSPPPPEATFTQVAPAVLDLACLAAAADPIPPDLPARWEPSLELIRWLNNYQVGGVMPQALERLLGRCRAHGIAVVLIGAPVSTVHRNAYTPQITAAYRSYLRALERSYGCHFYDYQDRVPDGFFVDHHHVSPRGGEFFSRLLAREVLIPAWTSPPRKPSSGPASVQFPQAACPCEPHSFRPGRA
jgi:hypothetical protein